LFPQTKGLAGWHFVNKQIQKYLLPLSFWYARVQCKYLIWLRMFFLLRACHQSAGVWYFLTDIPRGQLNLHIAGLSIFISYWYRFYWQCELGGVCVESAWSDSGKSTWSHTLNFTFYTSKTDQSIIIEISFAVDFKFDTHIHNWISCKYMNCQMKIIETN
jgi:hypothetical protein